MKNSLEPARKHPDSEHPGPAGPDSDANAPILLTGGDPAGVAPETLLALVEDIARATGHADSTSVPRSYTRFPIIYFATAGDAHIRAFAARCAACSVEPRVLTTSPAESPPELAAQAQVSIVDVRALQPSPEDRDYEPQAGRPDATGGRLAFAALKAACDFATTRPAAGIVTAPLSKEWVARGGQPDFRGHTEYLAERFERDVLMLMHGRGFSVIPLTVHIALTDVSRALRRRLSDSGLPALLEAVMRRRAYAGQRMALCGLNPHCGDGGLFGTEDQEFIGDWAQSMRARGIPLDGPLPADTLFTDDVRSKYRLILSCYHDQGLIPFKALEGHAGINATIGLPIPRTSPDHGTAFNIAGRGTARADSLRAALGAITNGELTG